MIDVFGSLTNNTVAKEQSSPAQYQNGDEQVIKRFRYGRSRTKNAKQWLLDVRADLRIGITELEMTVRLLKHTCVSLR